MRVMSAVIISLMIVATSTPVDAKRYQGNQMSSHQKKSKPQKFVRSSGRSGSNISCLTSETQRAWRNLKNAFPSVYPISTCRSGAVIATTGKPSQHRYGKAIDFDTGGHSKSKIVAWLRSNHSGGIMTYKDMDHIHMDTGPSFVKLGAWSGH